MSNLVVQDLSKDQLDLIKSTIAKGATDDELKLFTYRCKKMGLDPLKPGHIHFVKYGNNPGTIIIGIDGFRSRAASTGKHTGTKRGVLRDDNGKCIGAWCEVYRTDWTQCAREEISLIEYNTGKGNWAKMPETMIKKVAEVAALRMAFPEELGGVYSDDEMDQASHEEIKEHAPLKATVLPFDQGKENSEFAPGNYTITFGKFKGQQISSLDIYDLNNYVSYIQKSAQENGKEITGQVLEFMTAANNFLASREFIRF